MSGFNYWQGIKTDFANMISEIGSSVTINIPERITDAFGNLINIKFTPFTETLWIRRLNEVLEVQGIGQLNKEDIRFVARYDTKITIETEIEYKGETYIVLSLDSPDVSQMQVNRVGYAKRKLS